MPIGSSLLGRKLGRYFVAYADQFGFNTAWRFFSPGPSPVFFLEYDVERPSDGDKIASEPEIYPPVRDSLSWSESWNRELYGMRFLALNSELLEKYLVPFLCRRHPGATAISVKKVYEKNEEIELAGINAGDRDSTDRLEEPRQSFSCPSGG